MKYTKETLFQILQDYETAHGYIPTQRDLRAKGICSETPFYRVFGSYEKAKESYKAKDVYTYERVNKCNQTTLVVPDCHVGPNQDLSRFVSLNNLILNKQPTNIIFMGDFITLESLSNWDLNKAGIMEGRRYQEDINSGIKALKLCLKDVKETYNPNLIFIKGNHENRLDRYLDSKPELKQHLDLNKDLKLKEFGFDSIVEYKEYCDIMGTLFTHSPMNAANQCVSGKFAIHRAAEMTHTSLVFGHCHRKETVNFYRHGADDITQVLTCGAFFEHTDSYAYGGLNA